MLKNIDQTAAFDRAEFTPAEAQAWVDAGANNRTAIWLRDQGIDSPADDPAAGQFCALTTRERDDVIESGVRLADWARKAAAAAKRRATAEAKRAAAAELDRQIARDAGYPESSSWLADVKHGLLKRAITTPIFVNSALGWAVLTPTGRSVGDVIMVTRKDGGQVLEEITGITRLSARAGVLWDLATVEDAAEAQRRRDKAAAAAAAAEREKAAKAAAAAAARAEAAAAEEAALEAAEAARELTRTISAAEGDRVAGMGDDAVRAEVHSRARERVANTLGCGAPGEVVEAVGRAVDRAVADATGPQLRLAAVDLATAARMNVSRTPRMLVQPFELAATAADVRRRIASGRLDLTAVTRRGRRVYVDARWVDVGPKWAVLAAADAIDDTVTVTRSGGSEQEIEPVQRLPLGDDMVLITDWIEV